MGGEGDQVVQKTQNLFEIFGFFGNFEIQKKGGGSPPTLGGGAPGWFLSSKTSVNSTNQKETFRFFGSIFVQLSTNQCTFKCPPNPLITFVQLSTNCSLRFFREIFV